MADQAFTLFCAHAADLPFPVMEDTLSGDNPDEFTPAPSKRAKLGDETEGDVLPTSSPLGSAHGGAGGSDQSPSNSSWMSSLVNPVAGMSANAPPIGERAP